MSDKCQNTKIAHVGSPDGPVVTARHFLASFRDERGITGKPLTAWCPLCGRQLAIANRYSHNLKLHFRHDHR